jgi:hypothetical protein
VLHTAGIVGDLSCDILLPSLSLLSLTRNGITVRVCCWLAAWGLWCAGLATPGQPVAVLSCPFVGHAAVSCTPHHNYTPQGTIPDCFTTATTLKHLYLSDNSLSGPLPEFAADSALQLFFVRNQQREGKPTLSGAIPASVASATNLQYLQLASNALSGGLAGLPNGLK